jgi:hypothetical protein
VLKKKLFIAALLAPWFMVFQWAAFAQVPVGALMPLQRAAASTPAYITGCVGTSSTTTEFCGTVASVPAGAVMYAIAENLGSASHTATLVDSGGGTASPLSGFPKAVDYSGGTEYVWQIPNATAGFHTLTVTWNTAYAASMSVAVFSPASTTAPTDNNTTVAQGLTATPTFNCANTSATANGETIFSVLHIYSGTTTISAGTTPQAMTLQSASQGDGYFVETGSVASAGSSNYVQYGSTAVNAYYSCDTITVH